MERLGIAQGLIWIIRLFFQEANLGVSFNGSTAAPFKIQLGVRQGCTFAPYLFLLLGEVLNAMGKQDVES
jgi:hypothetical protein